MSCRTRQKAYSVKISCTQKRDSCNSAIQGHVVHAVLYPAAVRWKCFALVAKGIKSMSCRTRQKAYSVKMSACNTATLMLFLVKSVQLRRSNGVQNVSCIW